MDNYKYLVIGGGPAGYSAALKIAEAGKKVTLVEKDRENLGGTCLNKGCIPMKSYLKAAEILSNLKEGRNYGIEISYSEPDFKNIFDEGRKNIDDIKKGLEFLLNKSGVTIEYGTAKFISKNSVEITSGEGKVKEVGGEKIILATGSKPSALPGISTDEKMIVTSDYFFKNNTIPGKIVIVGGGYIGCELASFLRGIGREVSIVELKDRLMPDEDQDISRFIEKSFKKKGIRIFTGSIIERADTKGNSLEVFLKETKEPLPAELLVISCGRVPDIGGLNLDAAGVESDNGFIRTSPNYKTSNPDIFAAGDLIETPMLAHTALKEGRKAARSAMGEEVKAADYSAVPRIIFSDPQIGAVGMTERTAKKEDIDTEAIKNFFKANSKAVIEGNTDGFSKIIYNKKTREVLGAAVCGNDATELIHLMNIPVSKRLKLSELSEVIYGHPTLGEIFNVK